MDNYSMIQAAADDFETVRQITQETIRAVYPAYYPAGAVDFFCRHHSDESISADIASGKVYLLCDDETIACKKYLLYFKKTMVKIVIITTLLTNAKNSII